MDSLLDEPAVVLLLLSLAATFFVIEVALPTAGVAGTLALALGVMAAVGINQQGADWWPLLGPKLAVVMWAVMIARRSRTTIEEGVAVALFAGGSIGFGLLAHSPVTAAIGAAIALGAGAGFPTLHSAARRLLERPVKVGMDALVGVVGEVDAWAGTTGTVVVQGSRWNAAADEPLQPGDAVDVIGYAGMTVKVGRRVRREIQGV